MLTLNSNANPNQVNESVASAIKLTRALLTCALVAGPFYMVVVLAQAFTREGFDITRHAASLLSNGDLGWIQVSNFYITGLLVILGAAGIWRAQRVGGSTWGPLLIAIYGLGMIGGGIFKADPAMGFPVGTPADANTITTSGILHFATGGVGFLGLIVACLLFARHFAARGQRGWAIYSAATGIIFFAAFVGIASGAGNVYTIVGFWIAIVIAWAWLSLLAARLISNLRGA
jgi:hypothetical protein